MWVSITGIRLQKGNDKLDTTICKILHMITLQLHVKQAHGKRITIENFDIDIIKRLMIIIVYIVY